MENFYIGVTIAVIGMATVFVFLTIMIVAMNLATKIISCINKYFPEPIQEDSKPHKNRQDDNSEIALAIAVAMRERAKVKLC